MRRILTILMLAGISVTGFVGASSASAQTPTVDITSATLIARGAAVEVTAIITCTAGSEGFLSMQVTQRAGGRVAQGGVGTLFVCTGSPQTVTLTAAASAGGAPFRQGPAVVRLFLEVCGGAVGCESADVTEVIDISRR